MPKNITGGNKTKKQKNKTIQRSIVYPETEKNSAIGRILSNLGNGRCSLDIIDDKNNTKTLQGVIRGCIRRQKIKQNDIVIISYRNFNQDKDNNLVDIIHKYNIEHVKQLVNEGCIPYKLKSLYDGIEFSNSDDDNIQFERSLNDNIDDNSDSNEIKYPTSESENYSENENENNNNIDVNSDSNEIKYHISELENYENIENIENNENNENIENINKNIKKLNLKDNESNQIKLDTESLENDLDIENKINILKINETKKKTKEKTKEKTKISLHIGNRCLREIDIDSI